MTTVDFIPRDISTIINTCGAEHGMEKNLLLTEGSWIICRVMLRSKPVRHSTNFWMNPIHSIKETAVTVIIPVISVTASATILCLNSRRIWALLPNLQKQPHSEIPFFINPGQEVLQNVTALHRRIMVGEPPPRIFTSDTRDGQSFSGWTIMYLRKNCLTATDTNIKNFLSDGSAAGKTVINILTAGNPAFFTRTDGIGSMPAERQKISDRQLYSSTATPEPETPPTGSGFQRGKSVRDCLPAETFKKHQKLSVIFWCFLFFLLSWNFGIGLLPVCFTNSFRNMNAAVFTTIYYSAVIPSIRITKVPAWNPPNNAAHKLKTTKQILLHIHSASTFSSCIVFYEFVEKALWITIVFCRYCQDKDTGLKIFSGKETYQTPKVENIKIQYFFKNHLAFLKNDSRFNSTNRLYFSTLLNIRGEMPEWPKGTVC